MIWCKDTLEEHQGWMNPDEVHVGGSTDLADLGKIMAGKVSDGAMISR